MEIKITNDIAKDKKALKTLWLNLFSHFLSSNCQNIL